jgi:hypothetical protein
MKPPMGERRGALALHTLYTIARQLTETNPVNSPLPFVCRGSYI